MNRGQPRSGAAGESTRRMAAKRRGRRALIGLSGAVMAYGMFVAALGLHRIGSTMGVVLTALLLIGFLWVNAVLVFTKAFVEGMPPLKGVAVVNRKYLARYIERVPATGAGRAIWEKREEIAGKLGGGKLVGVASG